MIEIDGSYGEGGGQIVRNALAFSTLFGKPVKIHSIRKGRETSGLKQQHLSCINALKQLCGAKADGDEKGSETLLYVPEEIKARKVEIDIGTAGSVTLLLQSILLPCILAKHPVTLRIKGGTSGKAQMPFDYFTNVAVPHLRNYASITSKLEKRGYYPKGGGEIEIKINPKYTIETAGNAPGIMLEERGDLVHIRGVSHSSLSLQGVADRQADSAKSALSSLGCSVDISRQYCNTPSPGSGIALWAMFSGKDDMDNLNTVILGADEIGEKGKSSESVGESAARQLIKEIQSGATVDRHLADTLIQFMAVFGGNIFASEITKHTISGIYTAEKFIDKEFSVGKNTIKL